MCLEMISTFSEHKVIGNFALNFFCIQDVMRDCLSH